jgi:hypothetical protein
MRRNSLVWSKRFKLLKFLMENRQSIQADRLSRRQVAEQATAALGFNVTIANLSSAGPVIDLTWTNRRPQALP